MKSGVGKMYLFIFREGQNLMFKEKRIGRKKDNVIITWVINQNLEF